MQHADRDGRNAGGARKPPGERRAAAGRKRRAWPRRAGVLAVVLGSLVCVCAGGRGTPAEQGAERVQTARTALTKWVEIRRQISRRRRERIRGRELLNQRIDLVQREIASVRQKVQEAEESIAASSEEWAKLTAENDELKSISATLREMVTALEARALALIARLPQTLRESEQIKRATQAIPDEPAETELSLGQRFGTVVGILSAVNKFNQQITVTSEVRPLADGTSAEVTAVYVGIGQGYYVGANGKVAGIGTATEAGWTWRPANDAADQIARTIAILRNEQPAAFVRMPVEIR
jgi:hypothetical protein